MERVIIRFFVFVFLRASFCTVRKKNRNVSFYILKLLRTSRVSARRSFRENPMRPPEQSRGESHIKVELSVEHRVLCRNSWSSQGRPAWG